jgi:hypothetical protein
MKKIILLLFFAAISFSSAMACHFEFSTESAEKKTCKTGDILVLNIKLVLTHRNCSVAASQTKFKTDGIQVVDATEWKQESPLVFTRKVKVKVLASDKNRISLLATRSCDKDGGNGIFMLDKI